MRKLSETMAERGAYAASVEHLQPVTPANVVIPCPQCSHTPHMPSYTLVTAMPIDVRNVLMRLRVCTRGPRKGRMFYGCSRYPDCDFVYDLDVVPDLKERERLQAIERERILSIARDLRRAQEGAQEYHDQVIRTPPDPDRILQAVRARLAAEAQADQRARVYAEERRMAEAARCERETERRARETEQRQVTEAKRVEQQKVEAARVAREVVERAEREEAARLVEKERRDKRFLKYDSREDEDPAVRRFALLEIDD